MPREGHLLKAVGKHANAANAVSLRNVYLIGILLSPVIKMELTFPRSPHFCGCSAALQDLPGSILT